MIWLTSSASRRVDLNADVILMTNTVDYFRTKTTLISTGATPVVNLWLHELQAYGCLYLC